MLPDTVLIASFEPNEAAYGRRLSAVATAVAPGLSLLMHVSCRASDRAVLDSTPLLHSY